MPTSVSMIVKCISAIVVELIDEANCKSPYNLHYQCRNKVNTIYVISHEWSNDIGHSKDHNNYKWGYYQVSKFQGKLKFDFKIASLRVRKQPRKNLLSNPLSPSSSTASWRL